MVKRIFERCKALLGIAVSWKEQCVLPLINLIRIVQHLLCMYVGTGTIAKFWAQLPYRMTIIDVGPLLNHTREVINHLECAYIFTN